MRRSLAAHDRFLNLGGRAVPVLFVDGLEVVEYLFVLMVELGV